MNTPRCPTCNTDMDEGFLLDQFSDYRKDNLFWVSGTFSSYMMGHEHVLPVRSCRCPNCGLLLSYALERANALSPHSDALTPSESRQTSSTQRRSCDEVAVPG
ncbi:PF20097 family protein [Rhodopirellula sallentina]|nr:PF20097 family protein [Rhodopirellula sallentina]